ncbi:immunity protein Imm33 domain-containing protein [Rhizobium leguminosarum]|uniref:immunity protein Imm33 domain-containing protein n=1 Tax=Rhizobium leguminosarum TaxID=384 RepID=UPI0009BD8243
MVCRRYDAGYMPPDRDSKIGISDSALGGAQPINGLRHPPGAGTSGWFIWGGSEFSTASDFFKPLHIHHLQERCNAVLPYLALPPGWRFLIAPDYEDVWYDSSLS